MLSSRCWTPRSSGSLAKQLRGSALFGVSAPTQPRHSWSPPETIPSAFRAKRHSRHSAASVPSTPHLGVTIATRLNRGGNRDANRALWVVAMVRMARHPRTQAYVTRRTQQGLSKREIIRCLKRNIAREIYLVLAGDFLAHHERTAANAT
jgi:hypothetical protein